jgi:glycosyltransferase involved in cell wall biosynthesis
MAGRDAEVPPLLFVSGAEWFESRPGGLNRYFSGYVGALRDNARIPVVAAAYGDPPTAVGPSRGPAGQPWRKRVYWALREAWASRRADVYDSHFAPYGCAAVVLRRLLRKRSIVHFHGPWAQESELYGRRGLSVIVKRLIERITYTSADACVVLSQAFADVLHQDYGVDRAKIHVFPGATGSVSEPLVESVNDPHAPRVLCVRRLEARMGIGDLLAAWTMVQDALPDARLDIVGTGPLETALQRQIDAEGLNNSVVMHGRVPDEDLGKMYLQAALSVVPSRALEGFGLIVLESLARGTPVIATDCGGLPEILVDLDPSLVVPVGRADLLGRRLVEGLKGRLPSRADCVRHASAYSWERVARQHEELLYGLLDVTP